MLNPLRALKLWFGVSEPVHPAAYAFSGFTLMIVKYSVEALVIWQFTATVFWPWDFVNPLLSARAELLQPAPNGCLGHCSCGRCRFCGSPCR